MAFDEQGQADSGRAQGRDLHPLLPDPDRAGRVPARGHHLRPEHLRHRHRASRSTTTTRWHYIEATRRIKADAAARAGERRRQQRLVLLPRQRSGPRGDPRRLPLPRHRGRHGHGHRERGRSCPSTPTSRPTCWSGSRTWSSTAGPTRPTGCWPSPTQVKGQAAAQDRRTSRWREAPVARAAGARAGGGHRGLRRGGHRGGAAPGRAARSR